MSLATRNNGCLECRKRRVRCDKTEPRCLKCHKKGLACSGQGIECRFSSHMTSNAVAKRSPSTRGTAGTGNRNSCSPKPLRATNRYQWMNTSFPSGTTALNPENESESLERCDCLMDMLTTNLTSLPISPFAYQSFVHASSPRAALQTVPAQTRMLFDHFSCFIAAKMVVFDFAGNGYRQIILPLACQDEMVGQAVSVVAAFHLQENAPPQMRVAAEIGQQAILSKLSRESLLVDSTRLFSLSKWTTILLLLVGTTITGSNNYIHLLELLSCLTQSATSQLSLPETTRAFIVEQTHMFELFGFPLCSTKKGLNALTRCPEYYLDFLTSAPLLRNDPERNALTLIMKDAIRQACYIYQNRALHATSRELSIKSVERLRQTVLDMVPSVDGCHALVWAYFLAAAESILPEHRAFFSNRLRGLFEYTRFGTIPLALKTLEYIWIAENSTPWTDIVAHQRPLLIM